MEVIQENTDHFINRARALANPVGAQEWLGKIDKSVVPPHISKPANSPIQMGFKRAIDILGALIGLLLLLPAGLIVALLIKLDSRGPILFKQNRMGKGREDFKLMKFRSMYVDAEERLEEVLGVDDELRAEYEQYHKLQNDPRVTRLGRVLRKYSLDEFPQLLHVLLGDMSLVGPRPYLPHEIHKMGDLAHDILSVRPGLTGFWQTGGRNALSFKERLDLEASYVYEWSVWLDIRLMFKTLPIILRGQGAY